MLIQDTTIAQIEIDNTGNVYEQSYKMLLTWKSSQKDLDATCDELKLALCDDLVKKNSVAQQYCHQRKT